MQSARLATVFQISLASSKHVGKYANSPDRSPGRASRPPDRDQITELTNDRTESCRRCERHHIAISAVEIIQNLTLCRKYICRIALGLSWDRASGLRLDFGCLKRFHQLVARAMSSEPCLLLSWPQLPSRKSACPRHSEVAICNTTAALPDGVACRGVATAARHGERDQRHADHRNDTPVVNRASA